MYSLVGGEAVLTPGLALVGLLVAHEAEAHVAVLRRPLQAHWRALHIIIHTPTREFRP